MSSIVNTSLVEDPEVMMKRPVLVRRMTSGILAADDSIQIDRQDNKSSKSPTSTSDLPALCKIPSYCDSVDDTCTSLETSSISSVDDEYNEDEQDRSSAAEVRKVVTSPNDIHDGKVQVGYNKLCPYIIDLK